MKPYPTSERKIPEKIQRDTNHNSTVDVLRGLSILAVIILHINIRLPLKELYFAYSLPKMLYNPLVFSGFYGVCMFFVVSGFLIMSAALKRWGELSNIDIRVFYKLRIARIAPLLLALVAILSVLHTLEIPDYTIKLERASLLYTIFAALTFHINWLEITRGYLPASWDILWSLSIEEVFYVTFPILCWISKREWIFVAIISCTFFISPFARTVWFQQYTLAQPDHNHFAFLDLLATGCIAAIIHKRFQFSNVTYRIFLLAGSVLTIAITVFRKFVRDTGITDIGLHLTILAIGTAMILLWSQHRLEKGIQPSSRWTAFFRAFGRNSYEIYLTHMFIVLLMVRLFKSLPLAGEWLLLLYGLTILLCGALGEVVARYFSNPLNRLFRQKFISKQGTSSIQ
jgi:peptidoglycan/LPS O-acetylase OafA/YrhL